MYVDLGPAPSSMRACVCERQKGSGWSCLESSRSSPAETQEPGGTRGEPGEHVGGNTHARPRGSTAENHQVGSKEGGQITDQVGQRKKRRGGGEVFSSYSRGQRVRTW